MRATPSSLLPYGADPYHPAAPLLARLLTDQGQSASPLHPWSAAVHLAAWFTREHQQAGEDGLRRAVDGLRGHGAIDLPDLSGRTPLEGAIVGTQAPVRDLLVRLLLEAGANPSHRAPQHDLLPGTSPVILAVQFGALDALDRLLGMGVELNPSLDLDPFTLWGCETTALHEAVHRQNLPAVERLLAAGAKVRALDVRQRSPLLLACVVVRPTRPTPSMTEADVATRVAIVDRLIQAGADVNERLPNRARLAFAVTDTPTPVLERLLAAGVDPNLREPETRDTLLLRLSNRATPNLASVRVLLRAGANPRAVNVYGNTALHFATSQFTISWPLVTQLVDAGASLRVTNHDGDSPRTFIDGEIKKQKEKGDPQHVEMVAMLRNLQERSTLVRAMARPKRSTPVKAGDGAAEPLARPRRRL